MSRSGELSDKQSVWLWGTAAVTLIILVALLAVSCGSNAVISENDIPASSRKRIPLAGGVVIETGYYTDNLSWLGRSNRTVLRGMEFFYRQTGVQPYVYLTGSLGLISQAPTPESFQAYTEELYSTLFKDEGHFLLVIYENSRYLDGYLCCTKAGIAASSVMDAEAVGILLDYLNAAYTNTQTYPKGSQDKMLSDVFRSTAQNIMAVRDRSGWIIALAVLLTAMSAVILFDFVRAWRARKKEEEPAGQKKKQERTGAAAADSFRNAKRKT